MLPIKQIYIDSRYKSADSASDSDFYIDLPINLLMPANTGFYIDDVAIPVSWYSVTAGKNDKLWFKVHSGTYSVTIPQGDYSLVTFNQVLVDGMNSLFPNHFAAAPIVRENKVSIVGLTESIFQIMTDPEVKQANGDTNTTVNKILRNNWTGYRNHENPYVSGCIDLFPVRNLLFDMFRLGQLQHYEYQWRPIHY
jgi:hypothetical protein